MPKSRTKLVAVWPPTAAVSREAGHKPMSPLKAIRAKCYDCSYFQLNEIRFCEAVNCALWPFRAGKHPWRVEARKPPLTDANSDQQTAFQGGGLHQAPRPMPNASVTRTGYRHDHFPRPRADGSQPAHQRRLGCKFATTTALAAIRGGQSLHLHYQTDRALSSLSDGQSVSADVATISPATRRSPRSTTHCFPTCRGKPGGTSDD